MTQPNAAVANWTFSISSSTARYGPRVGTIISRRIDSEPIHLQTPGILTATSRGVVPHLSRDHHRATSAIRWVNIPFETFLEHNPPVPTLQSGPTPLHTFLGFIPGKHILSMSARDPYEGKEMPTNGNNHVSVYSLRGVRQLSPLNWRSYSQSCRPDIVFSLSDIPFSNTPYSQKRLTKSIERSTAWLSNILRPYETQSIPNVVVHMAGGTSIPARKAFSHNLLEQLYGPEAEAIRPLQTLDEGVVGYSFDLVPLRQSLEKTPRVSSPTDLNPVIPFHTEQIVPLLQASLSSLPLTKIRLINSTESPHEILHYISTVGIDLFDAHWAQRAADIGVALDFEFPTRTSLTSPSSRKRDIGHNLYDKKYALDFSPFASVFRGALASDSNTELPVCPCAACSPLSSVHRIYHGVDTPDYSKEPIPNHPIHRPAYTRAYIHHLLHTHEMSAHTLLVMHNLEILEAFFAGVRSVISDRPESWEEEVRRFNNVYDETLVVCDEAKVSWKEVELARGKGRLAREKVKQEESTLGTVIELDDS